MKLLANRIIAIVRTKESAQAGRVVYALAAGKIKAIEISLTTPDAQVVLAHILSDKRRDFLIGAGTALDLATCRALIKKGIDFIVSPVVDKQIIELCRKGKVAVVPGAFTPTEIWQAWRWGADLIKVFPVSLGGPQYIRDLATPLPKVPLLATGNINLNNVREYLSAGATAVAVGSALIDPKALANNDFNTITETARRFVELVNQTP